jgi:hypothetical protein
MKILNKEGISLTKIVISPYIIEKPRISQIQLRECKNRKPRRPKYIP